MASSSDKQLITAEGKADIEAELEHLKNVRRPEVVQAIKTAREFGDLKENAEYHAAKDEQGHIEARIRLLEQRLGVAEVAEKASDGKIGIGSAVRFRDEATGKEQEVTLVHPLEASMPDGKLSTESPIGEALLGAEADSEVVVSTPRGDKKLKVLSVS